VFHNHVRTFGIVLTLAGLGGAAGWGQVPDQQKTCSDLESRAFTIGTWMTHDWKGG
jgi:hypothetical protein